ncbi:SPOR domain-containing protein [Zavarzinella formosa]|uniref:SPOR domain-containing protein n=1 Tax=Zavarzinella formosa TaxID=360055 RepID=UPI0002FECEC6|nr:hypothetical protein [Zavarzinella formosa]
MFRKLLVAALVTTGLLGGMTLTSSTASAFPLTGHGTHEHIRFQVMVRQGRHWEVRHSFWNREEARRVARELEHRGFDARVEEVVGW